MDTISKGDTTYALEGIHQKDKKGKGIPGWEKARAEVEGEVISIGKISLQ